MADERQKCLLRSASRERLAAFAPFHSEALEDLSIDIDYAKHRFRGGSTIRTNYHKRRKVGSQQEDRTETRKKARETGSHLSDFDKGMKESKFLFF